jgi:hypothetical protein
MGEPMIRPRQKYALVMVSLALAVAAVVLLITGPRRDKPDAPTALPGSTASQEAPRTIQLDSGAVVKLTPDRRVDRVQHKDAAGLVPLEQVHTAEGVISIQRTFDSRGKLIKEEAILNGRKVPVP